MRTNIVYAGADELTYEIRGIMALAEEIEQLGVKLYLENIGDPVAKGHEPAEWIKDIIQQELSTGLAYGYSPTKGLLSARTFLAEARKKEIGVTISPDDILFFNGLGDAISNLYNYLNRNARVIGPSPAYPTHSSAEAAHAGSHHLTYNLDPKNNWLPDLEDLRNKVRYNPFVAGILIINPDNPTGMIYPEKVLREIVEIAKEYGLFVISDEIYARMVYGSEPFVPLASVIGDVPGIVMRGLSKELPWPGSRCGWIEVYNTDQDAQFARYVRTLVDAKMLEVCSTTLPQAVLPKIFSDPRYEKHLAENAEFFQRRAERAHEFLKDVPGITVVRPQGAFYISVVFDEGVLREGQGLNIPQTEVRAAIERVSEGIAYDKRFVYHLLGATGICVVPLSGFNSTLPGFRATLLERNDEVFEHIYRTLAEKIREYIDS